MKKESAQITEQEALEKLSCLHIINSKSLKVLFHSSMLQFDMSKLSFPEFVFYKHQLNLLLAN